MSDAPPCWILSEGFAGLQAQALGLAEAAGFAPELRVLRPARPWSWFPARFWPNPTRVVAPALVPSRSAVVLGCGGMAAAVLAALRAPDLPVVQVQHPRMNPRRFDVIIANTHDELTGPNVIVSRTALHRVTPARLAREAALWSDRFAAFKRPLVAVLLGGNNGRYRLDSDVASRLARDLAAQIRREGAGVVITPSRRTDPAVTALLRDALAPLGAWVWDFTGDNPYFGMLALADRIVVTQDSVSMISEASATAAPVFVVPLPGRSRRQGLFLDMMLREGRVRMLDGALAPWKVAPLNDTPMVAAELRRRLSL